MGCSGVDELCIKGATFDVPPHEVTSVLHLTSFLTVSFNYSHKLVALVLRPISLLKLLPNQNRSTLK
jgi:hypothetical protein